VRFINTDKEELGGVGGSEPPGPQKNPVNWWAADRTNVRFFNCRVTKVTGKLEQSQLLVLFSRGCGC
jgi:hypothetical protein